MNYLLQYEDIRGRISIFLLFKVAFICFDMISLMNQNNKSVYLVLELK